MPNLTKAQEKVFADLEIELLELVRLQKWGKYKKLKKKAKQHLALELARARQETIEEIVKKLKKEKLYYLERDDGQVMFLRAGDNKTFFSIKFNPDKLKCLN